VLVCEDIKLSAAYFGCFYVLGLLIGSIGPVMLALSEQTNSPVTSLSWCVTARSIGYLIGSTAGGVLLDKFPKAGNNILAVILVIASVCTSLVPYVKTVWLLCLFVSTQGLAMGVVDVVAMTCLIYVHGPKVGPWM
jgi:MFS family permease